MLDSVIRARNRWLKPEGSMFPSHATMYFAAISYEDDREGKVGELESSMKEWRSFSQDMKRLYNVDVSVLNGTYAKEQEDYYLYSALWTELRIEHIVGHAVIVKRLDLLTCTLKDAEGVEQVDYSFDMPFPVAVSGFASWFTVDFNGSPAMPVKKRIVLSTGPEVGTTHWGQQVFYLKNAIECTPGTQIRGQVAMIRQEKNKRLYNLHLTVQVDDGETSSYLYEIP